VTLHNYRDVGSMLASGSYMTDGMVICPCSSNTLGGVAAGLGDNLLWRAAQVTLKQARRLVLVHRELPLSGIDLRNMLRLQRAGAIICPAAPGFYMAPQTIADLVDFLVGRVLDLLAVPHELNVRWRPS
jgi:4-hydroxy-3-polyprenylbenzoate decarboxylase